MSIGNDGATNRHIPDLRFENVSHKNAPACKRMHLMLRWLVRHNSPVDIGIWSFLDQSRLLIPLDTHVHRIALELGLTSRKSADMKTAVEITETMKEIFPYDPSRGDFALFGYGVEHK